MPNGRSMLFQLEKASYHRKCFGLVEVECAIGSIIKDHLTPSHLGVSVRLLLEGEVKSTW